MKLYTAGHSTTDLDEFVELMTENEIEIVADVRSKPRSRLPHFDQVPLEHALNDARVAYRFLGDRLGGMPRDARVASRWRQGHLDPTIVAHLRSTEEWQDGITELTDVIAKRGGTNVCIICSEADANECHRKAVALDAAAALPGLEIVHIAVRRRAPLEVGVQEVML